MTFNFSLLFSQSNEKCNASVFINPDFTGELILYDNLNGKVLKTLKHNFEEEDYIGLEILNKNDSMFYVNASYEIGGFIGKGWIKKNKNIGIYSRAYDQPLNLYSQANKKSEIIAVLKEYNPDMYIVIDCIGKWLKVKTIIKGKLFSGWMAPDMQCCNVYSTCS